MNALSRSATGAAGAGVILVGLGMTVLSGWTFDIPALQGGFLGFSTMKPATALCFALTGLALLSLSRQPGRQGRDRDTLVLALAIGLIAGVSLALAIASAATGVEHRAAVLPSRYAALNFLVIGVALACQTSASQARRFRGQLLSIPVSLTALVWLIDYVLKVDALFALGGANGVSLPSALAFPLVSAGIISLDHERGVAAVAMGGQPGGVMLRRLFPAAIVVPILMASCWAAGLRYGLFSAHFGTALTAVGYIAILGTATVVTAASLNRIDRQRQQAAELLMASRTALATIVDSADDAIISKALDGTIRTWNPAAERMFGYRADEAIGRPVSMLIPEDRRGEEVAIMQTLATGRRVLRYETVRQRKDGSRLDVSLTVSPIRNRSGTMIGAAKLARDITDRKRADAERASMAAALERRVAERTAELTAANQELEAFAYAVAHDLRAPLRAMTGFSKALIEDYGAALPAEARGYLDQISIGGRHMGELIDGLLVLSRCTRGELQRDTVDISALADRIRLELSRDDPARTVRWSITPGLSIRGDARMFEVVMRTLLSNAWKFTGRTAAPEIRVHAGVPEDGEPRICVTDNGAGFDMKHADQLFRPFQRLHRQEEFAGTGVGLATAQRIIHRHGGTIQAFGRVAAGATFSFVLPSHDGVQEAA